MKEYGEQMMRNKWWDTDMKKWQMKGLEKEEVKYCALLMRMSTFVKNKVSWKNSEVILIGLGYSIHYN